MAKLHMDHEIRCDETTFWKVFVDKEFNERLYKDALGFPEFTVIEQHDSETEYKRKASGTPKMNAPAVVQKLLGSNFKYMEEGRLDKKTGLWTFKIIPSTLADKMKTEGTVKLEKAGEGKVRRIVDITIEAKVFGLGGILEGTAEKQFKDGWEKSAEFMNKWVADKK
jgi:hypothetical protein